MRRPALRSGTDVGRKWQDLIIIIIIIMEWTCIHTVTL